MKRAGSGEISSWRDCFELIKYVYRVRIYQKSDLHDDISDAQVKRLFSYLKM